VASVAFPVAAAAAVLMALWVAVQAVEATVVRAASV
jgi:hypothetical protein